MTSVQGIEPQTSRSQAQRLTTEPRTLQVISVISCYLCWAPPLVIAL
jgi:hypothetical protein